MVSHEVQKTIAMICNHTWRAAREKPRKVRAKDAILPFSSEKWRVGTGNDEPFGGRNLGGVRCEFSLRGHMTTSPPLNSSHDFFDSSDG